MRFLYSRFRPFVKGVLAVVCLMPFVVYNRRGFIHTFLTSTKLKTYRETGRNQTGRPLVVNATYTNTTTTQQYNVTRSIASDLVISNQTSSTRFTTQYNSKYFKTTHITKHTTGDKGISALRSTHMQLTTLRPSHAANRTKVGIGMGVTSKGIIRKFTESIIHRMPLLNSFITSFCRTASLGFDYHFYLAHDMDDKFFIDQSNVSLFKERFAGTTNARCRHLGPIEVHLVRCEHAGRPAWAQSDAMVAAHNDGCDFLYRVNDDSEFVTRDWTNTFISELKKMNPPLVGVVGPNHSGGNTAILTYDFTHRTHVDIFGYHYPRAFPWWFADDWITKVYRPHHSKKLMGVRLKHTLSLGSRYSRKGHPTSFVEKVIQKGHDHLQAYLAKLRKNTST